MIQREIFLKMSSSKGVLARVLKGGPGELTGAGHLEETRGCFYAFWEE